MPSNILNSVVFLDRHSFLPRTLLGNRISYISSSSSLAGETNLKKIYNLDRGTVSIGLVDAKKNTPDLVSFIPCKRFVNRVGLVLVVLFVRAIGLSYLSVRRMFIH